MPCLPRQNSPRRALLRRARTGYPCSASLAIIAKPVATLPSMLCLPHQARPGRGRPLRAVCAAPSLPCLSAHLHQCRASPAEPSRAVIAQLIRACRTSPNPAADTLPEPAVPAKPCRPCPAFPPPPCLPGQSSPRLSRVGHARLRLPRPDMPYHADPCRTGPCLPRPTVPYQATATTVQSSPCRASRATPSRARRQQAPSARPSSLRGPSRVRRMLRPAS